MVFVCRKYPDGLVLVREDFAVNKRHIKTKLNSIKWVLTVFFFKFCIGCRDFDLKKLEIIRYDF